MSINPTKFQSFKAVKMQELIDTILEKLDSLPKFKKPITYEQYLIREKEIEEFFDQLFSEISLEVLLSLDLPDEPVNFENCYVHYMTKEKEMYIYSKERETRYYIDFRGRKINYF